MRQKSKLGYDTVTELNSKGQGREVGEYFEVVSTFFSLSSPSLLHSFAQSQKASESKAFSELSQICASFRLFQRCCGGGGGGYWWCVESLSR